MTGSIINARYDEVAPDDLIVHPDNPRIGDVSAIAESIDANGFHGVVTVQESTGYVIAGNHRVLAARQLGMATLPVAYVDVSDTVARRIMLADNRAADLGYYDDDALEHLLQSLAAEDALVGSLYESDDLSAVSLPGPGAATGVSPDEVADDLLVDDQFGVIVMCDDEQHQTDVYRRLNADGFRCRVVVV